jgi:hypothetical protein
MYRLNPIQHGSYLLCTHADWYRQPTHDLKRGTTVACVFCWYAHPTNPGRGVRSSSSTAIVIWQIFFRHIREAQHRQKRIVQSPTSDSDIYLWEHSCHTAEWCKGTLALVNLRRSDIGCTLNRCLRQRDSQSRQGSFKSSSTSTSHHFPFASHNAFLRTNQPFPCNLSLSSPWTIA